MRLFIAILGIVLFAAISPVAHAQNPPSTNTQAAEYMLGSFLLSHSGIANDLQSNPSLVSNLPYLQQHPQLQNFLTSNPQVTQMLSDPNFRASQLKQQDWRGMFQNTTGETPGSAVGNFVDRWLGTGSSSNSANQQ